MNTEKEKALQTLADVHSRSKAAQAKFAPGTAQYTLQVNRLHALEVAKTLIEKDGGTFVSDLSREELERAQAPLASLISKSEKSLTKLKDGSWQQKMLIDNLEALHQAYKLLDLALTEATAREMTRDEYVDSVTIGERDPLEGDVFLADYSPDWPLWFASEKEKIEKALGDKALQIHHVGSTSVPNLVAKPLLDLLLLVPDAAKEEDYVVPLEALGYTLRIREPDWYGHRLLKGPENKINLHVFTEGCEEAKRMLLFRDWLREHPEDRELYAKTKQELAKKSWTHIQHYADAKSEVVAEIMARATKEKLS